MARTGGWRHVLIVALIALAVAIAVGVGISMRSAKLPDQVVLSAEFGAADLRLNRYEGEIRFDDLPAELQRVARQAGAPTSPEREPVDVGAVIREMAPAADVLRTESGYTFSVDAGQISLRSLDLEHPLTAGMILVDGPVPGLGEVLVSPALMDALDLSIGDTVDLVGDRSFTVVGTARDPRQMHRPVAVFAGGVDLAAARSETVWLVDVPGQPDRQTIEAFRRAFARDGHRDLPSDVGVASRAEHAQMLRQPPREITQTPTFVAAVVGAALLLQVAFVSAAAFATGTRRRLRDLGLLGAVGASPAHIRGVVMREAAVLGTAGALLGLGLGVLGASTLGVYVLERFGGNPVPIVRLHPGDLAIPTILGLAAALAAAYLPARTAGKVPVTTALAGRLPVGDVPRWVTPTAIVSTVAGLAVLYTSRRSGAAGDDLVIGVGFLATAMGTAALSVPLLAALGRAADRLPVRPRLAVRDTVRQRTRSAAAVAALTVVLIVPVLVAVSAATDAARWQPHPDTRRDIASVSGPHYRWLQLPPTGQMVDAAEQVLPPVERRVQITRLVDRTSPGETNVTLHPVDDPDATDIEEIHPPAGASYTTSLGAAAVATDGLLQQLGLIHLRERIADGTVVLLDLHNIRRERPLPDGRAAVIVNGDSIADAQRSAPSARVSFVLERPAAATWDMPEILMSAETAGQLDLIPIDGPVLLDLERPISIDLVRQLEQVGRSSTVPFNVAGSSAAYQPSPTGTIGLAVGIALIVALIISGMTAALAATESDHDLELITAVGAAPSIRRRFHGWQAAYHALLAAVLAVPAGLLIYRAATIRTDSRPWMELPGWWLTAIVVAVPLTVGLTHAVFMRSARLRAPRRIA